MACNCKNTITSFLGGDVPNPTTFLNCGEADGTYNNPLSTGKTQCVAEDNVLRILDEYYISGTVKTSGEIVFEKTVTGETVNEYFWQNDGFYFKPIAYTDRRLSASSLNVNTSVKAGGDIEVGTHNGSNFLYIEKYSNFLPYAHLYSGRLDNNVESGFRFLTRNSSGTGQEAFTILGSDRKATFQGNLVISGASTVVNALSASSVNVGNGNGIVSANTFTAPQISIGKELGVITGTTIAGKYSGSSITNNVTKTITMTVAKFRPGMIVEVNMGVGSGDINIILPEAATWVYGKYTFIFNGVPNAGAGFELRTPNRMDGLTVASDGNEVITGAAKITFANGTTVIGTKIEVIASNSSGVVMSYVTAVTTRGNVTPS